MPVSGHQEPQPSVTGVLLRGRPHARPVRAAVGADADQIESLDAFAGLGCREPLELWLPAPRGPDCATRTDRQRSSLPAATGHPQRRVSGSPSSDPSRQLIAGDRRTRLAFSFAYLIILTGATPAPGFTVAPLRPG